MDPLASLTEFATQHPRLLVLTGAGCSTEAGIPDYRDANGAWKRNEPMRFQLFVGDALARKRYWARSMLGWPVIARAEPNAAHRALAQLAHTGHVYSLVTQNVDGLHQRAGSPRVIDLHGSLANVICLASGHAVSRATLQAELVSANPGFADAVASVAPDGDTDLEADFATFVVPPCAACGGVLKPDVVFYGANVPRVRVDAALDALDSADAVLVVGSSLMVYSGFRFCERARERGMSIAALNQGRTRADALFSLKIDSDCASALESLVSQLAASASAPPRSISTRCRAASSPTSRSRRARSASRSVGTRWRGPMPRSTCCSATSSR